MMPYGPPSRCRVIRPPSFTPSTAGLRFSVVGGWDGVDCYGPWSAGPLA
jgi:hypothetical protein